MPVLPAVLSTTRPPGLMSAALFRFENHLPGGPVLDRLSGIEELRLAEDRAAGRLGRTVQFDQRRVADSVYDAVTRFHFGRCLLFAAAFGN